MRRTCKWCGRDYNTEKESSLFCVDNPRRQKNLAGSAYRQWRSKRKNGSVKIAVLLVP